MNSRNRIYAAICLLIIGFSFASFQSKNDKTEKLHALVMERLAKASETDDFDLLEKTITEIAPQLGETDTLALLYHRLGAMYFNHDLEFKALGHYKKALDIRQRVLKPNDFDLTKTLQGYGRTLARVRRLEEAVPLLAENLKIRQATLPPQSDSIAEALMIYGGVFNESGNYAMAIRLIQQSIDIFQKNQRDTNRLAYAFQYIGVAYAKAKTQDKAVQSFLKSIALMQYIKDTKGESECNHNIGVLLTEQNKYAEALPYFQNARSEERRVGKEC